MFCSVMFFYQAAEGSDKDVAQLLMRNAKLEVVCFL